MREELNDRRFRYATSRDNRNLKLSQLFIIQLWNNNSSKFKNTRLMKQFLQKKLLSMKLKFDVLL